MDEASDGEQSQIGHGSPSDESGAPVVASIGRQQVRKAHGWETTDRQHRTKHLQGVLDRQLLVPKRRALSLAVSDVVDHLADHSPGSLASSGESEPRRHVDRSVVSRPHGHSQCPRVHTRQIRYVARCVAPERP